MNELEPNLYRVTVVICAHCLTGDGGECHVPGCAFWMNRAPKHPLDVEHMTHVDHP